MRIIFVDRKRWNAYMLLRGPALILDGIVAIVTLGFVNTTFHSEVSMAFARENARKSLTIT